MTTESGIWGRSAPSKNYVIFSIDGEGDEFTLARFIRWMNENTIGHKVLVGCYKGVEEISFIVNADNIPFIYENGWIDKQESILHLGGFDARDRRTATLYYMDTWEKVDLGKFVSVSEERAKKETCWTYDQSQNQYFICVDK